MLKSKNKIRFSRIIPGYCVSKMLTHISNPIAWNSVHWLGIYLQAFCLFQTLETFRCLQFICEKSFAVAKYLNWLVHEPRHVSNKQSEISLWACAMYLIIMIKIIIIFAQGAFNSVAHAMRQWKRIYWEHPAYNFIIIILYLFIMMHGAWHGTSYIIRYRSRASHSIVSFKTTCSSLSYHPAARNRMMHADFQLHTYT